jgi:hypothetical protein
LTLRLAIFLRRQDPKKGTYKPEMQIVFA